MSWRLYFLSPGAKQDPSVLPSRLPECHRMVLLLGLFVVLFEVRYNLNKLSPPCDECSIGIQSVGGGGGK